MKLKTFLIVGCLGGLFTLSSCTAPTNVKDYSAYVNPFIGTGGHGHTFPGAVVPHGMIQPSPDTRIDGWDACSGYYYADSTINGFSHTHTSAVQVVATMEMSCSCQLWVSNNIVQPIPKAND